MKGMGVLQLGHLTSSMPNPVLPQPAYTFFVTKPLEGAHGITDTGRRVSLFHYEAVMIHPPGTPLPPQTEKMRQDFLRDQEQKFLENHPWRRGPLQKLLEPNGIANCHGWVFAGGRYGILDELVPLILQDNGYAVVEEPREGDLAVFMVEGCVQHSGIVRTNGTGKVVVESKFGPFGVFLHAPDVHLYHGASTFYRSRRGNDRIEIRAAS
jgi:hypothetical protein